MNTSPYSLTTGRLQVAIDVVDTAHRRYGLPAEIVQTSTEPPRWEARIGPAVSTVAGSGWCWPGHPPDSVPVDVLAARLVEARRRADVWTEVPA